MAKTKIKSIPTQKTGMERPSREINKSTLSSLVCLKAAASIPVKVPRTRAKKRAQNANLKVLGNF